MGILDVRVRAEIRELGADGTLDPDLATAARETALAAPPWDDGPLWVHSDLLPVNLLACSGKLTAVIDFGILGIGDPAVDMLPAWAWLAAQTRDAFRAQVNVDDATWARPRLGLGLGLGAVHYYRRTNPVLAAIGGHAISQVLSDFQQLQCAGDHGR